MYFLIPTLILHATIRTFNEMTAETFGGATNYGRDSLINTIVAFAVALGKCAL